MNEGIVGGVYWVEKGHMVPEAMGGQASDSICHGVLTVSHCSSVQVHLGIQIHTQFIFCMNIYFETSDDTVSQSSDLGWDGLSHS